MNDNGAYEKRHWTWGLSFVAAGVILTAVGLVIGMHRYGMPGQYSQKWLLIPGVIAIAAGAAWDFGARHGWFRRHP